MKDLNEKYVDDTHIIINSILTEFKKKKIPTIVGMSALSSIIQSFCVTLNEDQFDEFIDHLRDGAKQLRTIYIKNNKVDDDATTT